MSSIERRHFRWPWTTPNLVFKLTLFFNTEICEMVKDTARVNPLRLYMRTRPRNDFTSSYTTHPIHATGSRAKLSTKKSIKVKNKTVFLKHRVYIDNRHSLWWLVRNWLNPHWNEPALKWWTNSKVSSVWTHGGNSDVALVSGSWWIV